MVLLLIVCSGICWVGLGMLLVMVVIFFLFELYNVLLILVVLLLGVGLVWWLVGKVVIIDML